MKMFLATGFWSNIGSLLYPYKISLKEVSNYSISLKALNRENVVIFFHSWLKERDPISRFKRFSVTEIAIN